MILRNGTKITDSRGWYYIVRNINEVFCDLESRKDPNNDHYQMATRQPLKDIEKLLDMEKWIITFQPPKEKCALCSKPF